MIQIYGNVDLLALKGASLDIKDGKRVLTIPVDQANLRYRQGKKKPHVYLPFFCYEHKKFNYDLMINRAQTKEERDAKTPSEVLGNGILVSGKENKPGPSTGQAPPRKPPEEDELVY